MTMTELEHQRKGHQRGDILRLLQQDYNSQWTSVANIAGALDMLGDSVSAESLGFHLTYLAQQGLIQIWRNADLPNFRRDRTGLGSPDTIRFAKLTSKGIQLLDGHASEDPMVLF